MTQEELGACGFAKWDLTMWSWPDPHPRPDVPDVQSASSCDVLQYASGKRGISPHDLWRLNAESSPHGRINDLVAILPEKLLPPLAVLVLGFGAIWTLGGFLARP